MILWHLICLKTLFETDNNVLTYHHTFSALSLSEVPVAMPHRLSLMLEAIASSLISGWQGHQDIAT